MLRGVVMPEGMPSGGDRWLWTGDKNTGGPLQIGSRKGPEVLVLQRKLGGKVERAMMSSL